MKFIVDTKDAEMWGLSANELLVLSALRRLCHKTGNWQGSYAKLAELSCCESKSIAFRACRKLQEKNLISFQYGTAGTTFAFQYGAKSFQCGTILERKEAKESSIYINNNKDSASVVGIDARARDYFMEFLTNKASMAELPIQPPQPSSAEYLIQAYKIIVTEFGYLRPRVFLNELSDYYKSHGKPIYNPPAAVRQWMRREAKFKDGRRPVLNQDERLYLRTMLDSIEQRLVTPFCDRLLGFELYEKKVVFVFADNDECDRMLQWMVSINLREKMQAYGREIFARAQKL